MRRASALAALMLVFGCASKEPAPQRAELEGQAVARVGDEIIVKETVEGIARAQGVDARKAVDLATFDALAANESRARGLDKGRSWELRTSLVRLLLRDLAEESRAEGPATEAELEKLTQEVWFDVARPEAVAVVHAVVLPSKPWDDTTRAQGIALAEKVRQVVAPAAEIARADPAPDYTPVPNRRFVEPTSEEFIRLGKTVPAGDLRLVVEDLEPLGRDNKTIRPEYPWDERTAYDPLFVSAAFALESRGQISEVVRGQCMLDANTMVDCFHVIMLLGKVPASQLTLEQRRSHFADKVIADRTRRRIQAIVGAQKKTTNVEYETNANGLLEQVKVAP